MTLNYIFIFTILILFLGANWTHQEFLKPSEIIGRHILANDSIVFDYTNVYINYGPLLVHDSNLNLVFNMKQLNECNSKYTSGCDIMRVQLFEIADQEKRLISESLVQLLPQKNIYTVQLKADGKNDKLLRITKTTEALVGTVFYTGVSVDSITPINCENDCTTEKFDDNKIQEIYSKPAVLNSEKRRIEVYGDSLTCGYGILGKMPCSFTPQTEDGMRTYAGLLADHFGADLQVVCVSGIGLLHDYGSESVISPVNQYKILNQSLASLPSSVWDFKAYKPDLIIIYLGANDFSTQPQPTGDLFMEYYLKYLDNIWSVYGKTNPKKFVLNCGDRFKENPWCSYVLHVAEQWNSVPGRPQAHVFDLAHIQTEDMDGCDYHPDVTANKLIFERMYPIIQELMNW